MRVVGIVVGTVVLVGAAVVAIATVLSLSNATSWTDLEPGECLDLAAAIADADGELAEITDVDTVGCGEPHDAQIVAVGELNPGADREHPDDRGLLAEVDAACARSVPESVDPAVYGILPIAPDARTWEDRGGRYACVAVVVGGGTVVGSALD